MFQTWKAAMVRDRESCQTIRKNARCKPGDTLSLRMWVGKPRAKGSRHYVIRQVTCESVRTIWLRDEMTGQPSTFAVSVGGRRLDEVEGDDFARADGFYDAADMRDWFLRQYGLPFTGHVITWGERERDNGGGS
jgi:hypothetical protein